MTATAVTTVAAAAAAMMGATDVMAGDGCNGGETAVMAVSVMIPPTAD
jgi:hypothetical protein